MLQRILGGHSDIHTVSEPWLMLHPLYALRSDACKTEYNAQIAGDALRIFLHTLPNGEDEYISGVRWMYSFLYQRALESAGKSFFLDKTPRYYFIVPELYHVFPEARYIVLLRNPLAVLASIYNTWVTTKKRRLYYYDHDLLKAPQLLLAALDLLGEQGVVVRYEQLVNNPHEETRKICERVGIDFEPDIVVYGNRSLPHFPKGDLVSVDYHQRPLSRNAEKWVQSLADPQFWRLAYDYLRLLGRETIAKLGYDYEELTQLLMAHRPNPIHLAFTLSLKWMLKNPTEEIKRLVRDLI